MSNDGSKRLAEIAASMAVPDNDLAILEKRKAATVTIGSLTFEERVMVRGLAEGKSRREVAHQLGMDSETGEAWYLALLAKLQVKSSADVVRIAIYAGLS